MIVLPFFFWIFWSSLNLTLSFHSYIRLAIFYLFKCMYNRLWKQNYALLNTCLIMCLFKKIIKIKKLRPKCRVIVDASSDAIICISKCLLSILTFMLNSSLTIINYISCKNTCIFIYLSQCHLKRIEKRRKKLVKYAF